MLWKEKARNSVKCHVIYEKPLLNSLFIIIVVIKIITDKQRKFLQKLLNREITKEYNPKKFSATWIRIQDQIDKNMANLVWAVDNFPEILKDSDEEINNVNLERYRRFKAFAYVLAKLNPMTELEEVDLPEMMKKLQRLYPKFYFRIISKGIDETKRTVR